jgi:hypothetical protein
VFKKETHYVSQFSTLHLNIRSLVRNFQKLTELLDILNMQFSVIGITETWLQDSAHLVDINGFKFFHKHRSNRKGGGVGLYMSDDFEAKVRDDLCFVNEELAESLFLEIPRAQGKNIVIGVIYRPPNQSVGDFYLHIKS